MENLFSYGTLQEDRVQMNLFGRLLNGAKDFLAGWKLVSIEITDETFLANGEDKIQKTLIQSYNDTDLIAGTVFEISEAELLSADRYEPANYHRIKVVLQSGKEAWIYTAGMNPADIKMPRMRDCPVCSAKVEYQERYPNRVCAGCAARTADENGRKISYMTLSFAGGLRAAFDDTGERYADQFCYVDGIKCRAEEDRFGRGIVIEIVK